MEKAQRTRMFIAGILLIGFLPIVFATFFLLASGVVADILWVLGVVSIVDGAILLLWYGALERKARRTGAQEPQNGRT